MVKMKTEIIKKINVKFEEDDKELIKKVIALIADLIKIGDKYDCDEYEINDIYRETEELDNLIDFLKDLAYSGVIKLV